MGVLRLMLALNFAALSVAGGCAPAAGARDRAPAPTIVATDSTVASFPAAANILAGFEVGDGAQSVAAGGGWREGDRVLLGLRIIRGGAETVRYLEVEQTAYLGDPAHVTLTMRPQTANEEEYVFESPVLKTHVRLYDESGEQLAEVDGGVPMILLGVGLYDALRRNLDVGDAPYQSRQEFARTGMGAVTLFVFSSSLSANRVFRDLLDGVVDRPALWRLLFNQSIAFRNAEPGPAEAEPWQPGAGRTRPAAMLPLELAVAGKPVLRGRITVVPQDPPLGLCGGLVYAEAHNPRDPEARVVIRLLATQRGPYVAPIEIDPRRLDPEARDAWMEQLIRAEDWGG